MFKPFFLASALMLFGTPLTAQASDDVRSISAEDQVAAMKRGVNIVGYDPYWNEGKPNAYEDRHFKALHDAGFSTVRVVIFTFQHLRPDGNLDPKWLAKLDWVIDEALKYQLNVIVDEHDSDECTKDQDTCLTRLKAVWAQLSERYRDKPDTVMFELLNEPHRAQDAAVWNAMIPELLAVIRKDNPKRNIVVGAAPWNTPDALKDLVLPENDRHLIATFHYYEPAAFTLQGAKWASPADAAGHDIPFGTPEELARISQAFDAVANWGKAHHRPILLGEFGTYETAPMASRVVWTNAVARAAEAHGFAWAYWQFSYDFILYDFNTQSFVKPILNALIPESKE